MLFRSVATQWRVSMGGPVGLDYNVVFRLLDRQCADGDEWDELFADVMVMEGAALEAMRKK